MALPPVCVDRSPCWRLLGQTLWELMAAWMTSVLVYRGGRLKLGGRGAVTAAVSMVAAALVSLGQCQCREPVQTQCRCH